MSGHSKWSTIKRQKGVVDAKRSQLFTKLASGISIAAREGGSGDPATNFKLRLAIDLARAANMPKENIERAIGRGLGVGEKGQAPEEVVYEAFGPGGVALMISAATDNKNRTSSEVKSALERDGGTLVTPGAVSHLFHAIGLFTMPIQGKTIDTVMLDAADAGADDISETETDTGLAVEVFTKVEDLEKVKQALSDKGYTIENAQVTMKPLALIPIADAEIVKRAAGLIEHLEALDDVWEVYTNFAIPETV